MKTSLTAFTLALGVLAAAPTASSAFWNSPQTSAGYGWLQARAMNCFPSLAYHGPLYNYGPYYGGEGYYDMFVQNPWCGAYVPAWPETYAMNGYPHTQWSTIHPALVNPPMGPGYGMPVGVESIPGATTPATPATPKMTEAPVAQVAPLQAPTITPASYRPFRARFQR